MSHVLAPTILAELAKCGRSECNGCYEVDAGIMFHPPKPSAEFLAIPGGAEDRPMLKMKKPRKRKDEVVS